MVRPSFSEEVWTLNYGVTTVPFLASSGNNIIACTLQPMTSKADNLPLETEQVARGNNT